MLNVVAYCAAKKRYTTKTVTSEKWLGISSHDVFCTVIHKMLRIKAEFHNISNLGRLIAVTVYRIQGVARGHGCMSPTSSSSVIFC